MRRLLYRFGKWICRLSGYKPKSALYELYGPDGKLKDRVYLSKADKVTFDE